MSVLYVRFVTRFDPFFFRFQCVQYVDSTVLPELVPRLSDLLRTGIGLGTKVTSVRQVFLTVNS